MAGSSLPALCEAGKLCEVTNLSPYTLSNYDCPQGYYCEQGTSVETACTGLSTSLCPTGSKFEGGQSVTCDPRYYLSGSNCKFCDKGYVCTGGAIVSAPETDAEGGYICPRGYYCDPEISPSEIECPVGTFNQYLGMGYLTDCIDCNAGYYQGGTGSRYCYECGNGAFSDIGATECYCQGAMKTWIEEQNQCVSNPRYTDDYTLYSFIMDSQEYNYVDSVAIMCDPQCASGTYCHMETMTCESTSCDTTCPNGDGSYSASTGTCQCVDDPTTANDACDETCQAASSEFYYNSTDGTFCCDYKCGGYVT